MNSYQKRQHEERLKRRKKYLRMRERGLTLQEIGEKEGISRQAVHDVLNLERKYEYNRALSTHRKHKNRPTRYKPCVYCEKQREGESAKVRV